MGVAPDRIGLQTRCQRRVAVTRNRVRVVQALARSHVMTVMVVSLTLAVGFLATAGCERREPRSRPVEGAKPYFNTTYYPRCALVQASLENGTPLRHWTFGESERRCVLVISRGLPHSTVTTDHGWSQTLSIESPAIDGPTVVAIPSDEVRVCFSYFTGRDIWDLRPGSAKGNIEILAVSKEAVTAKFAIHLVAGDDPSGYVKPEYAREEVFLEGTAEFALAPHPNYPRCHAGFAIQDGSTTKDEGP